MTDHSPSSSGLQQFASATLPPGVLVPEHTHVDATEVFFVQEGIGLVESPLLLLCAPSHGVSLASTLRVPVPAYECMRVQVCFGFASSMEFPPGSSSFPPRPRCLSRGNRWTCPLTPMWWWMLVTATRCKSQRQPPSPCACCTFWCSIRQTTDRGTGCTSNSVSINVSHIGCWRQASSGQEQKEGDQDGDHRGPEHGGDDTR